MYTSKFIWCRCETEVFHLIVYIYTLITVPIGFSMMCRPVRNIRARLAWFMQLNVRCECNGATDRAVEVFKKSSNPPYVRRSPVPTLLSFDFGREKSKSKVRQFDATAIEVAAVSLCRFNATHKMQNVNWHTCCELLLLFLCIFIFGKARIYTFGYMNIWSVCANKMQQCGILSVWTWCVHVYKNVRVFIASAFSLFLYCSVSHTHRIHGGIFFTYLLLQWALLFLVHLHIVLIWTACTHTYLTRY